MTFDAQVQTTTQDYIVPKITDQVLQSNVLTMILLANAKPWAGESYKVPIKLSSHTQGGSFDDFSEFKTANENVRQMAHFDLRAYYQNVTIGGIARSANESSGPSKTMLLNMVKMEMESVYQDMADDIGTVLQGTGTGNSSKDFLGIGAGIDDGNTVATYGGLSRATYTAWKSTIQTSVGAWDFTKARTLVNSASVGGKKPNLMTCNETTFGYLESDYMAIVDYNVPAVEAARASLSMNGVIPKAQSGLVGQALFDVLYFAGTPTVKDDKAGTGVLNAMNTEFLHFYGCKPVETNQIDLKSLHHEGNEYDKVPSSLGFGWTGFVRPAKQYSWMGQYILLGNCFTTAPRLQSSSAGITS